MVKHVKSPRLIKAMGNKPKYIEEFFGNVSSGTSEVSIARLKSPAGWFEPGQKPDFDEYTLVLEGMLRVKTTNETFDVHAGEAIMVGKGDWVQYSTPGDDGAEYVAICLPAFSPETVHRDE